MAQTLSQYKPTQGPTTVQGQLQQLYNEGALPNPYGLITLGNQAPQTAPLVSPRTNVGSTYQYSPQYNPQSPMQQALQNHIVPNKQGAGPLPGAQFTHPFANSGIGGSPWHDPALHKQIQAYEQLVAKDRQGGLTTAERKQLRDARAKLQQAAKDQAGPPPWMRQLKGMLGQKGVAPGDAFQSVLRDMMAKMFKEQGAGQAGGAGG